MSEFGNEIRILPISGLPEFESGDNPGQLLADAIAAQGLTLVPDDVLVVTHKIISKSEGRVISLLNVEPRPEATAFAARWNKDPRQVEVVLREAKSIVRMERGIIIAETIHGFVCANAGVDASNVAAGEVCLLPIDPDESACQIRATIRERTGVEPAVIISDSFGRPWRNGIVNVAVGVAGIAPLADYRGQRDPAGYELQVSEIAIADELAGAAELVMNKLDQVPAALVRGYHNPAPSAVVSAQALVRDASIDLFR